MTQQNPRPGPVRSGDQLVPLSSFSTKLLSEQRLPDGLIFHEPAIRTHQPSMQVLCRSCNRLFAILRDALSSYLLTYRDQPNCVHLEAICPVCKYPSSYFHEGVVRKAADLYRNRPVGWPLIFVYDQAGEWILALYRAQIGQSPATKATPLNLGILHQGIRAAKSTGTHPSAPP